MTSYLPLSAVLLVLGLSAGIGAASAQTQAGQPPKPQPEIRAEGFQLGARLNFGGVVGGLQQESGLVSEKGDTATTTRSGFFVTARYFPLSFLGVEAETGGAFGSATAPGATAMNFTNAWTSNLGLSLIPWQRQSGPARIQIVALAGGSYTVITLADDYKEFVEKNSQFIFYDEAGKGFGWYGGMGFRLLTLPGVVFEGGARYAGEYPKFPKGTKAFDGHAFLIDLGCGYRF